MAERKGTGGGETLSLQTLVIAAAASATAAIVVSHVWRDGTVIAAAMTPVIVSIVKEMLARPMESELVKKPVQQVSARLSSGRRVVPGRSSGRAGAAPPSPDRPYEPPPLSELPELQPDPGASNGDVGQGDPVFSPVRTYGRPAGRRRLHVKLAIVTGLLAFLIAAAVLTLPELIFGGAVTSHHSTTFFGGGSSKSDSRKKDNNTTTQPEQQKPSDQKTTPATPPPTTGGKTPTTTTPAPTTPQQTTPQQTTPQPTTPLPPPPTP